MSSPTQNGSLFPSAWMAIYPYIAPPVAASISVTPVFYGLMVKSALQLGQPIPSITLKRTNMPFSLTIKELTIKSIKAGPTFGCIIGVQMVIQNLVERYLIGGSQKKENLSSMILSSAIVGGISSPTLAVFNGLTRNRTMMDTLHCFNTKQACAIIARETSFIFSVRISGPVSVAIKSQCGDNNAVGYACAFITGAIGSIVGHPPDTMLTRWQENIAVNSFRQTLKGILPRAVSIGCFSVIYNLVLDLLKKDSQENA